MSKAKTLAQTVSTGGALENPTNVLLDSDIGGSVQAYDSNLTSFLTALNLPTTDGTTGQVVTTDGSGNLTFSTPSSGVTTGKAIAMSMIFGF